MKNYSNFYKKITAPVQSSPLLMNILKLSYYILPPVTAIIYFILTAWLFINKDYKTLFKVVVIPFITFMFVTVFRKIVNKKRPYTAEDITPLICRDKKGESFPSRHTASLAIISMAGIYCNLTLGIILWIMTIIQGLVRILCGVHYPKDIIAGIIISILFGMLFFL